jgi:hypothetical protein
VGSGRLCAAWTDARRGDDDATARCSSDQGRRWGALRRLNDDPPGNGASQYLPRLAMAPRGRIDAVFLDRRRDADNAFYDVFYTFSEDGGRTFARNLRLTPYRSDSRIGYQYANRSAVGQFEFGARLGLLSADGHALAAWPDTHNVSPLLREQDLFATQVTGLSGGGGDGLSALVPAAALVAALAVLAAFGAWLFGRRRMRAQEA